MFSLSRTSTKKKMEYKIMMRIGRNTMYFLLRFQCDIQHKGYVDSTYAEPLRKGACSHHNFILILGIILPPKRITHILDVIVDDHLRRSSWTIPHNDTALHVHSTKIVRMGKLLCIGLFEGTRVAVHKVGNPKKFHSYFKTQKLTTWNINE